MDKQMFTQLMASAPPVPKEFEPNIGAPPELDVAEIRKLGACENERKYISEALYLGSAFFNTHKNHDVPDSLKDQIYRILAEHKEAVRKYNDSYALARIFQWPAVYADEVIAFYNITH